MKSNSQNLVNKYEFQYSTVIVMGKKYSFEKDKLPEMKSLNKNTYLLDLWQHEMNLLVTWKTKRK